MKKEDFYENDLQLEDEENGTSWIFKEEEDTKKRTGQDLFLQ